MHPKREHFDYYYQFLKSIPSEYLKYKQNQSINSKASNAYVVLDFLTRLKPTQHYLELAISLCNEISAHYNSHRVSLGWLESDYIYLKAVSHIDQLNRKMEFSRRTELAMEEVLDYEAAIFWSEKPQDEKMVTRNHEELAYHNKCQHLLSLPLYYDDKIVGVIMIERNDFKVTDEEYAELLIICDQITDKLYKLKQEERWFGKKCLDIIRQKGGELLGAEHTLFKFFGVVTTLLVFYLCFASWDYRVEAPFIVKTKTLRHITAPFDGYIEKSFARVGDRVKQKQVLIELNTDELLLQESELVANLSRYSREAGKARAGDHLADMQIAYAQTEQAQLRLEQLRNKLQHDAISSPISGLVVEGDLSRLVGAPVRKGD
ncbi:efflux RND transporter periplasmic adaptor subunit, partial [Pseudomonadota bacterium]|nr:efflux RND transporter periplasmic adaptor subunit [Pseudomonadota bacterium]